MVVTGSNDGPMEHRIDLHHGGSVAEVLPEQLDGALYRREVFGSAELHRNESDGTLQDTPGPKDVDHRLFLQCDAARDRHGGDDLRANEDPTTFARSNLQQPGVLEYPERLSQGGPGDPQLSGELSLVRDAVPGGQPAPLDALDDIADRGFEGLRRAYGRN